MSKFGSLVPSDKPFRVNIKLDGKQITDVNDRPFFIEVYAEDSVAGRRFDKEWREVILTASKEGREPPTQEERSVAKCAALTAGWYLVDPDTREQINEPFTVENAKELYSLPATGWIWIQVWLAANNTGNFIKRSAKSSLLTQSGPSETAAE